MMQATPSTENELETMRAAVESELRAVLDLAENEHTHDLTYMLAYHLGWEGEGAGAEAQGKRIRPSLVLLASRAVNGAWREALPAAAAVEMLHNFSLIHDDIQDQSALRRGRATVWVKWGMPQAINAGDLMYSLAYASMTRLADPNAALEGTRILQKACVQLTQGQYLDISYEGREDLTLEDYWPMVGGKTAALLAACAELGGLAGGALESTRRDLWRFGWNLGLAFQAQDDWLGVWGDAALTGKSTASDLLSRKKTLPVLYALERNPQFAAAWREPVEDERQVQRLADLLVEAGARAYTEAQTERLTQDALAALRAAVPGEERLPLEKLALRLLGRKS